ncbi:MAG: DUF983 domain-containing protein [Flavobacteriales bacterium]|nr:DUF983 domain-containing protein [Flavobacteriales bacterium]
MEKGDKFYGIFKFKCPHCHEGEFYVDRDPYHLSTAGELLDHCSVCNRKYEPEPGFYYGGMYVTYALAVATFATTYLAMMLIFPNAPLWLDALIVIIALVVLAPYYYALSKTIWAALFIPYKGVAITEREREQAAARAALREGN